MFWRHYVGRPSEESSSSRTAASVEKKLAISRASLLRTSCCREEFFGVDAPLSDDNHILSDLTLLIDSQLGARMIVAGDFNITPQWKDHPRYGQWGVHHELCLARLTAFGFEDCVARFHDKYQPTLWKGNLPPYQNDWMFARGITPLECRVLNAATERTKTPGNHSPIIATFDV